MNITTAAAICNNTGSSTPLYVGFIAAIVATLFFGSNFVPVKKFETGDGIFFQWVLCVAIWHVGLIVGAIRHFPKFYPLAMLGGALWCTGNVTTVFIIKTIGLAQGFLIWGSSNLIFGWLSGRFGWFGIKKEIPNKPAFNYAGVGLALLAAVIYIFIKSDANSKVNTTKSPLVVRDEEQEKLIRESVDRNLDWDGEDTEKKEENENKNQEENFIDRMNNKTKRILGTLAAVFAGSLYGLNFTPVIYIQDRYKGASNNGLDYVFAHFSGILAMSTLFMFLYCAIMKNRPRVYPRAVLPGLISGIMWGIADVGWFIANQILSEPISFPIVTTIPPFIGVLWGVFVFKEIKGKRNFILLAVAGIITITGAVLTGLSKGGGSKKTCPVTTVKPDITTSLTDLTTIKEMFWNF